jgi:hypothetical protein
MGGRLTFSLQGMVLVEMKKCRVVVQCFFHKTQNKTKALSGHSTLSFFHNTLIVVENIEWLLDIFPTMHEPKKKTSNIHPIFSL